VSILLFFAAFDTNFPVPSSNQGFLPTNLLQTKKVLIKARARNRTSHSSVARTAKNILLTLITDAR